MFVPQLISKSAFLALYDAELGQPGATHFLRYATRTREHLIRRADRRHTVGWETNNCIVDACWFCNTTRDDLSPIEQRVRMQDFAALGIHPVANQWELKRHVRLKGKSHQFVCD